MLVLLPITFFFSVFILINYYFKVGRRVSLLVSAVVIGTVITFMTEGLSFFHTFSFYPVMIIWAFLSIIAAIGVILKARSSLNEKIKILKGFQNDERLLFLFLIVILTVTSITAIVSAPNTWDSMTYHLARVEHWIQNRTIAYYPTHILRQLYYCPWAEFTIAHLRLLTSWESVVNLLQWFSMLGSLLGVSLITKQLGGTRRAQLMACLTAASLPMGILQSVSTQTDYVETFWLISFIFFVLEIHRSHRLLYVFCAGLSLGLALLTKGYAYILMVPFFIFLIVSISGLSKKIQSFCIIILCVLVLNIGYYERNQMAFGSLTVAKGNLATTSSSVKVLVGNLMRNWSVEFDSPSREINLLIFVSFARISDQLGINFFYDSHASASPMFVQGYHRNEGDAGNFLQIILFTLLVISCFIFSRLGQGLCFYTSLVCLAGALFCLCICFQSWITRFHLPLFIMLCPVCGVFLSRILSPIKFFILGQLLFMNAYFFLFFNVLHPWFGPNNMWQHSSSQQQFLPRINIMDQYTRVVGQINKLECRDIGIITSEDAWEYPLWRLLREGPLGHNFRIEHVMVKNESSLLPYPLGDFKPCAIVILREQSQLFLNKKYKNNQDNRSAGHFINKS